MSDDMWNAAFEAGWRTAAAWAQRGDLTADIGSPAYQRDREAVKAELLRLIAEAGAEGERELNAHKAARASAGY